MHLEGFEFHAACQKVKKNLCKANNYRVWAIKIEDTRTPILVLLHIMVSVSLQLYTHYCERNSVGLTGNGSFIYTGIVFFSVPALSFLFM